MSADAEGSRVTLDAETIELLERLGVDAETRELLARLGTSDAIRGGDVTAVIGHLIHSAAAGVRRAGSWERAWVVQAFGDFNPGAGAT